MQPTIVKFLLSITLYFLSAAASAQCGAGIPSGGNPLCIPPDRYNNQNNNQSQTAPVQQTIVIRQKWADRWGAIIYDQVNPVIGVSHGLDSEQAAIKVASSDCRSNGGGQCSDPFVFNNQCAALAAVKGGGYFAAASSEEKAMTNALKMCKKGQQCIPYYSSCSHAEAVPIR